MTDRSPNVPTYDQFLEYRAVIVQAIAEAWHDAEFREELIAHPVDALHKRFDYRFPMKMHLKVHENSATWTPLTNGGWTTNEVNGLDLVLPPAPPPEQRAAALAAYNARHISLFGPDRKEI
ncbi:BMA_0021/BMA_0022 family TOMM bacteriocin [Burkholderia pseudomallei]|uniref:BMA_0021/BMA_0022 family TOMM bacteriocin n=1 Tax=Burkholderia pseudomallei TaxID=28450 RepID=UPI0006178D2C|nr:BMA_0021/BMA_0022 family TOMM bacteriocin [Burkholderia pseudomallei]KKB69664.1 ribosomal natural product, two-chain TOMM family protein [Burkholderia pseudomallei MSHR1079]ONB91155.1 hypothetical protein AQ906_11160 [Burkholderia pseudomallei]